MRVVIALGGNALLRRGQAMTAENQRENARIAAQALAEVAREHQLIITHGNGPQVGLLALQSAAYTASETYPLDVLGAETEGMIGYMIEQELREVLPNNRNLATLLTMVEVDPHDPAFAHPTKFIGPVYSQDEAKRLATDRGWTVKQDGDMWRRVVPSPIPQRILEIETIRLLEAQGVIVICVGGGGIPVTGGPGNALVGIEAVIDKDRAGALLAKQLKAEAYLMLTDADAVYLDWNTPHARPIRKAAPDALAKYGFAEGSMGPKVEAACSFAESTGGIAGIGALADAAALLRGAKGTLIATRFDRLTLG